MVDELHKAVEHLVKWLDTPTDDRDMHNWLQRFGTLMGPVRRALEEKASTAIVTDGGWEQVSVHSSGRTTSRMYLPCGWLVLTESFGFDSEGNLCVSQATSMVHIHDPEHDWRL